MPKYVVYEIWTRSRIVEAGSTDEAYDVGEPEEREQDELSKLGFSCSNWHAVPIDIDQE